MKKKIRILSHTEKISKALLLNCLAICTKRFWSVMEKNENRNIFELIFIFEN